MIIRSLDELLVYRKAVEAADAVSAILTRSSLGKDFKLREQLSASSSRVPALIAEGFEQKSDRHFAHYMYIARGSASETRTHLVVAWGRKHLAKDETNELCGRYDEICRMSTGLIQHLERENRSNRFRPTRTQTPDSD
ncbi:MAG TPA: four helix bundle protein [Vicinamibacterales bacterium]|nr:four helix bundle protein [Vicinamibacterales bacterium]